MEASVPAFVPSLLNPHFGSLTHLFSHTLRGFARIAQELRLCPRSHPHKEDRGDATPATEHADVAADQILIEELRGSRLVAMACSMELQERHALGGSAYVATFCAMTNPEAIASNNTTGSLMGIWPTMMPAQEHSVMSRTPREMVASFMAVYGPRLTVVLAIGASAAVDGVPKCVELTWTENGWEVTREKIQIAAATRRCMLQNLSATADNPKYHRMVDHWTEQEYQMCGSGNIIADVCSMLTHGEGVVVVPGSAKSPAGLSTLFHCAPLALIVESAGGKTCALPERSCDFIPITSLLDVVLAYQDQRSGMCMGSTHEVDECISQLLLT